MTWKKDILYLGGKEAAEWDATGMHITQDDHLGSPRFMSNASGTLESTQKFLPFGESIADAANAAKFAKGFTNHEQTDPSGLIYMQARMYLPWVGRFASPDPARDQHFEQTQSWNIYSYVGNNPTMKIDPTGMVADGPLDTLIQTFSDGMKGYAWRATSNLTMNAPEAIRSHLPAAATPPDTEAAHLGMVMADIHTGEASLAGGGGAVIGELGGAPETGGASLLAIPATATYAGTVLVTSGANLTSDVAALFRSGGKGSGNKGGGEKPAEGKKPSSAGKMDQEVKKGQAPREVDMVHGDSKEAEAHIHYKDGTSSTRSGEVHDKAGGTPNPSKGTRKWIESHGWVPPKKP